MQRCTEPNIDPLRPDRLDDLRGQPVAALATPRRNLTGSNVHGAIDVDSGAAIAERAAPIAGILASPEMHRKCVRRRGRIRLQGRYGAVGMALVTQLQNSGVV